MTREEAIRIIETVFQDEYVYKYYDSITHQALNMAIEALSAEPKLVRVEYSPFTVEETSTPTQTSFRGTQEVHYYEMPSVVRCKDCRWWQDNNGGYPHANCHWCETETPDADDFCSLGERREPSAEQTEYKLPGHDEVMEALDKLTLKGGDSND